MLKSRTIVTGEVVDREHPQNVIFTTALLYGDAEVELVTDKEI